MLNNAENNATAMRHLEVLLMRCDPNITFNHLQNCIRCFPHIINICTFHVILSSTQVPQEFAKSLGSDAEFLSSNIDDDDDDDDDDNDDDDDDSNGRVSVPEFKLNEGDLDLSVDEAWVTAMKRDPVKHARRVVQAICSSDKRKLDFKKLIKDGNESGLFRDQENRKMGVAQPGIVARCQDTMGLHVPND